MEKMNRRQVIRNVLFFSAGAVLIPSCARESRKPSISLTHIKINGDQQQLMESLTETIIPKTKTPGANDLSSQLFVLMMVDDCQNHENQEKFMKGMDQFEALAKKQYGKGFVETNNEQKTAILNKIEGKKDIPDELTAFYALTKRLTIQSFMSSQYFLTKIQVYEMVPGRYHGCVPVKSTS
jgi:Gluconate 2-dehydrogenase subunit 3